MAGKHLIWCGVASLFLAGCLSTQGADTRPNTDIYPGVPIVSRDVFMVNITGEQDNCYGMTGAPYPCFVGALPSGKRVTFDEGIRGYAFQPGQAETIKVEQITYDFTSPNAPMDVSSVVYVRVDG